MADAGGRQPGRQGPGGLWPGLTTGLSVGLGIGIGLTAGHALADAYGWGRLARTLAEAGIAGGVALLVALGVGLVARRRRPPGEG